MYFMEFDALKLLEQYKRDFPPFEKSLRVELSDDERSLRISSPGLYENIITLRLNDYLTWSPTPWNTFEKERQEEDRTMAIWAHPHDDFVELFTTVENHTSANMDVQVISSLDLSNAPVFKDRIGEEAASVSSADDQWTVGILWEDSGDVEVDAGEINVTGVVSGIAPGEQRTLRGRMYLVKSGKRAFDQKLQSILNEWQKAVPFRVPLRREGGNN
jgi:hypothetical protein